MRCFALFGKEGDLAHETAVKRARGHVSLLSLVGMGRCGKSLLDTRGGAAAWSVFLSTCSRLFGATGGLRGRVLLARRGDTSEKFLLRVSPTPFWGCSLVFGVRQ